MRATEQLWEELTEDLGMVFEPVRKRRTLEENVRLAERLAKEHGGILQCPSWLQKNRYGGLDGVMRKYPKMFSHIKQDKRCKTLEENVKDAERLAEENSGILQCSSWLHKNGHSCIEGAMRKYPKPFSHIKQDKRCKTLEENVKDAERLAKEHGGILQCTSWLQKNGHARIKQAMKRYPKPFSHIPQECKSKTPEENVKLAERLAEENGGILQCFSWLRKNGHSCIEGAMKKYPEPFSHISRMFRGKIIKGQK